MTAGAPALTALLDELDRLRAAATPGPWVQQNGAANLVYGDTDVGLFVCNTGFCEPTWAPATDAALIVAAVNAVPKLTAAVRAVLALADAFERDWEAVLADYEDDDVADVIRRTVAAAFEPTP